MKVGEVIVSLRKQKKVKQKELAESVGVTPTHLSLVESNQQKPSMELLSKIADYFDLPLTSILFQALNGEEIKSAKQKKYYKAAEPVVNALMEYLLSGDGKPKRKKPLDNVKHTLRKRTA